MDINSSSSSTGRKYNEEYFVQYELNSVVENLKCADGNPANYGSPTVGYEQSNDDRKLFAKLFEEGMNSGDPELFRQILNNIIDEECTVESNRLVFDSSSEESDGKKFPSHEEKENSFTGQEAVANYFVNYIVSCPDALFFIHEWKIFTKQSQQHQHPANHSCLVFKFSFTGSKVFKLPTRCQLPLEHENEDVSGPLTPPVPPAEPLGVTSPPHSVIFRERSRTSKYDSRKRGKIFTVGEHVNQNEIHDHQMINVQDVLSNDQLKEEISSQQMMDVDEHDETGDLLPAASKVNIQGVMRFYINEHHKIYKIQCVHIHGH